VRFCLTTLVRSELLTLSYRADYAVIQDKSFKKYAKAYADDQDLFFKDFSAVVSRLFELGVPTAQWVSSEPWIMKNVDETK
jgi:cytochrome c peroxidase